MQLMQRNLNRVTLRLLITRWAENSQMKRRFNTQLATIALIKLAT